MFIIIKANAHSRTHVSRAPKPRMATIKRDLEASFAIVRRRWRMENREKCLEHGTTLPVCAYASLLCPLSKRKIYCFAMWFPRRITSGRSAPPPPVSCLSIFRAYTTCFSFISKACWQCFFSFNWPLSAVELMIYKLGLTAESKVNIRAASIIVNGLCAVIGR